MTILIAGASKGLGLELAKYYAAKGKKLALFSRDMSGVIDTSDKSFIRSINITNSIDLKEFVHDAEKKLGPITRVVCTAAVQGKIGPFINTDIADWVRTVNINLVGPTFLCNAILPSMISNGYGKIVLLSGGGALNPRVGYSAYATSKAGLVRFAETLAHEVFKYNIDINCVSPGIMNTDMLKQSLSSSPSIVGKDEYGKFLKYAEDNDTFISPINLIRFLLSRKSDGITGKIISATWDDWSEFNRSDSFKDIYTLRRIK